MNENWITWPFQYPFAWLFFSDQYSPGEVWERLAAVPTLVVHREGDGTVPFEAGRRLFDSLPASDKTFWAVPGEGHITTFSLPEPGWRERFLDWLETKLGPPP
jgi:pimeloyl-ACP methyl ester carboxylesterase